MKLLAMLTLVFAAAPAFSQTRVYTNADLGRPLSPIPGMSPADAAAILLASRPPMPRPDPSFAAWRPWGPQAFIIPSSPTAGPFGEFAPFSESRRLDGTRLSDPPWSSTTYLPWSRRAVGPGRGPRHEGGSPHGGSRGAPGGSHGPTRPGRGAR